MAAKTAAKKTAKTVSKRAAGEAGAAAKSAAAAKPAKRSALEVKWVRLWGEADGPELVEEYRFHPTRKWRADFAHEESKVLIEIEGGAWGGRHTRGAGFTADLEKYLAAFLGGWTVVRIGAKQIDSHTVQSVIDAVRERMGVRSGQNGWRVVKRDWSEHSAESIEDGLAGFLGGFSAGDDSAESAEDSAESTTIGWLGVRAQARAQAGG